MRADDPVVLFERATVRAATVMAGVSTGQLGSPTPCADWDVQQLIDHMVGGTDYLLAALAGEAPPERSGRTVEDYTPRTRAAVQTGLRAPGGLERMCVSPLGFEWPVAHAVAGTFMDALIHTWDLATATGQDASLDPELVEHALRCSFRTCPSAAARAVWSGRPWSCPTTRRPRIGCWPRWDDDRDATTCPTTHCGPSPTQAGERCCDWCGTRNEQPPNWPTLPGCRSRRPASTSSCSARPAW